MQTLQPSQEQRQNIKELKKSLAFLSSLFIRARTMFSVKKIKTYKDLMLAIGHSEGELEYAFSKEQLESPITFKQIGEIEDTYKIQKEQEFSIRDFQFPATLPHTYEGYEVSNNKENESHTGTTEKDSEEANSSKETEEEIPLFTSPRQKAKLFKFQSKAALDLIHKSYHEKRRAVLLRAAVGTGKTYILGAYLRYILDKGILKEYHCTSPWPIVWITKATIVEQTKRVLLQDFNIDTYTEVNVINIEQLRARFGEYLLDEKTIVRGGEERIVWMWRERMLPLIVILDESQLAKNMDSTQSKIIQALSIVKQPIFFICSSATPFTRVTESCYFCINTHMTI